MHIVWNQHQVTRQSRAILKTQRPCITLFSGLSCTGKSTMADTLEQKLNALSQYTYLLDGDNFRHGLNKDLAFSAADRIESIRCMGEMPKLFVDAGLNVYQPLIPL